MEKTMFQTVITRKNLISISLSVFYAVVLLFTGMCLNTGSGFVNKKNPIAMLAEAIGFDKISAGTSAFIILLLISIYVIIFVAAICYERRYAIVNGQKPTAPKMLLIYAATFVVCTVLSFGLGLLFHKPWSAQDIGVTLNYIGQSLAIGTIIYVALFAVIGAVIMFVVNFILIDKPYKFFDEDEAPVLADDIEADLDLKNSFDVDADDVSSSGNGNGGSGGSGGQGGDGGSGDAVVSGLEQLEDREKVFPTLCKIDLEYDGFVNDLIPTTDLTLEQLATGFRNYLCKVEKLYFEPDVIRFFISGLAASHFEILEGLSGTGKSSLPRYFAKYVNGNVLFMPVQATWRDKTNILGFFNEFSKTYSETDFLCELYRANYNPDVITFFVLDEMNISRVEYYFADLLSVLEYPKDEWRLKVMTLPYNFVPPMKIDEGFVKIPENCYFVGTANKDDSTFTITDKVYDRAITIEFVSDNRPFTVDEETPTITLSHATLRNLFDEAQANEDYRLNDDDMKKIRQVFDYAYDAFDIAIGNRILNQIANVTPAFVAAGGTKEAAVDFMIAKKLVSKVEGRFEEHIKDSLNGLIALVDKLYGPGVMTRTIRTAKIIMRNL